MSSSQTVMLLARSARPSEPNVVPVHLLSTTMLAIQGVYNAGSRGVSFVGRVILVECSRDESNVSKPLICPAYSCAHQRTDVGLTRL
jgi:hypothetical protein